MRDMARKGGNQSFYDLLGVAKVRTGMPNHHLISSVVREPAFAQLMLVLSPVQNASESEIKKAYRKKAVQHHPDKGGDEETFKVKYVLFPSHRFVAAGE